MSAKKIESYVIGSSHQSNQIWNEVRLINSCYSSNSS